MTRLRKLLGLRTRDDGFTTMQIVAAILAPAIALTIGMTLISFMRTGDGLVQSVERDTQMRQMVERLQQNVTNMTAIDVVSDTKFTVYSQPSKRSAYALPSGGDAPTTCVSTTWSLTPNTWQPVAWLPAATTSKLSYVQRVHEGDGCDTAVKSETKRELAGFETATTFQYENAYGRDLTFADGVEAGVDESVAPRPEGLFDNEWGFSDPGLITLTGDVNQVFGATPVQVTATTPLKQMRPGVVQAGFGDLEPPSISRSARGGDLYRATFSARTSITDPRASIAWQWREKLNDGSWSAWSAWSSTDYHERNVRQGEKWNIQAQYKVTLDDESAQSEATEHEFVRGIEPATAPTVNVTAPAGSANGTITAVTPAGICAPGTTVKVKVAHAVGTAAFSSWTDGTTKTAAVGEGQRLNGRAQASCVSPYAESTWVTGPVAYATRPISSTPVIDSIVSQLPAGQTRGYVKASFSGCPTGTRYEAAPRYRFNEDAGVVGRAFTYLYGSGVYKSAAATVTYDAVQVREGERFQAGIDVRCATDNATGSTVTGTGSNATRGITVTPKVTGVSSAVSGTTATVTGTFAGCPAWLTYEGRITTMKDATTSWSIGGWSAASAGKNTRDSSATYGEGTRFKGGLDARCVSPYTQGPIAEGRGTDYVIRPITSKPTVANMGQAFRDTNAGAVGADISGCPSGLTYKAAWGWQKNLTTTTSWGDYAAHNASSRFSPTIPTSKVSFNQGNRFKGAVRALCVSPYAEGPATTGTNSAWIVRPITTKPTISGASAVIKSDGTMQATASLSGCPTDTTYRARLMRMTNAETAYSYGGYSANGSGKVTRESSAMHYEGYRTRGGISAMCVDSWNGGATAQGPDNEGVDTSWYIRPVEDTPTVTNPNAIITTVSGKLTGRAAADLASCASPLKYEARLVVAKNGSKTYSRGAFSAATSGRETRDSTATWQQGDSISGGISARCVGLYDTGDAVEAVKTSWTITPVSKPAAPVITYTSASSSGSSTAIGYSINAPSCASGTTLERQHRRQKNQSGVWGAWGSYSAAWSATTEQGSRYDAQARARCVGDNDESDWVTGATKTNIKAIATKPTIASPTMTIVASTNKARATAKLSGCPSGTTYEARLAVARNAATAYSYGTISAAKTGTVTRDSSGTGYYQGDRVRGGISARCVSGYANGPLAEGLKTSWYIRPVSTKPVIGTVTSKLSSANLVTSTKITSGCPAGTGLKVRTWSMRNGDTAWKKSTTWYSASVNTTISKNARTDVLEGYRARGAYAAICDGAYANSAEASKGDGGMIVRAITSKPTAKSARSYTEGSNGKWDATLATRCPSHLTTQVQFFGRHDYVTTWKRSAWLTQPTSSARLYWAGYGINQGAQWEAGADIRCASSYTQGSANQYKGSVVKRPITTIPSGSVSARLLGDGTVQGTTGSFSACPAGTTVRWRTYSTAGWGAWKTSGQTGWHYITSIGYGGSANVAAQFMCRSDFVNGPASSTKYSANVYRSYPAASMPGGLSWKGGVNRGSCDPSVWGGQLSWGAAANASSYQAFADYTERGIGKPGTTGVKSTTARSIYLSAKKVGSGAVDVRAYVRSVGSGGTSGYNSIGGTSSGACV